MAKSKFERDPKRSEQESKEGLEEVKDMNAPKERFQREQQVAPAVDAEHTTAGEVNYSKKVVKPAGAELKQAVVSKVLTSAAGSTGSAEQVGVSSPARVGGVRTLTYSGTDGTILGSAAGTPIVAKDDRASSRFGKKMDATNKKINYIASEQVIVDYTQPKPLAEDDGVQGYNGTPKNTSARLQKCSGTTPADLMYDRSIDEITRDELVYVSGQQVKTYGVQYIEGPTKSYEPSSKSADDDGYIKFNLVRGDYLPDHLEVKIKKLNNQNAFVSSFKTVTTNVCTGAVPPEVAQLAGTNAIIDMNAAEIDRQGIDNKAGIETSPDWCPLGRAVKQPTQTVSFLRDLEQMTGAEIFASYKFANKALAYQLNKASKDGMDTVGPMNEMLVGLVAKHVSSLDFNNIDPFAKAYEKAGAASLLIDIFDSKVKYNNKADVLTQPRSLKMHLQTADNNINVFRVKPEFVAALNSVDVFSTIDRGYDALGPVYLTDCIKLIHPYNFESLFAYTSDDGVYENRVWSSTLFKYMYKNRMSRYIIKAAFPLMAGISYWFDLYADKIFDKVHEGNETEVTINVPIVHSTRCLSLWDFLVCSAVPYIQVERTNALKDILDYEVAHEYPFHQLKDLGSLNPMNAVNYSCVSRDEPLQLKEMLPSAALSWIMPELYTNLGTVKETRLAAEDYVAVLLPHYFTEGQFKFGTPYVDDHGVVTETTVGSLSEWAGLMSYPVTRAGATNGFLNDIYGMSERDYRLTLDRQIVPVGYLQGPNYLKYTTYKHSQAAEGQVIMRVKSEHLSNLTAANYISVPREMGWFMVAPEGVCQPARLTGDANNIGRSIDFSILNTSYRCRTWENAATTAVTSSTSALDDKSVAVNRAQNFIQRWIERLAVAETLNNGIHNAIVLSINDAFTLDGNGHVQAVNNVGRLDCETTGTNSAAGLGQQVAGLKLIDIAQALYNRVQKLVFIINPFDSSKPAVFDPYAFAHLFNMAGFMESDYNEDVYNRINQVQNQGWLYTADPFVRDSVVFKDAVRLTEI
jgi:hypothetical protein